MLDAQFPITNARIIQGKIRKPAEFLCPDIFLGLHAFWFNCGPDKDKI
jgi:hypothetical protein